MVSWKILLHLIERHVMGFTIVPCQPFGYNYLEKHNAENILTLRVVGVKLEIYATRNDMNLCMFDPNPQVCMVTKISVLHMNKYDGKEPFLRKRKLL